MRYLGGKDRIGGWLASVIMAYRNGRRRLIEPMCGGLSVTSRIVPAIAADSNVYLIALYRAMQKGWEPPSEVDEAVYGEVRRRMDQDDPLTAFVGFGCSFSGKWWGGMARSGDDRNYALNAKRSLTKKMAPLSATEFICRPYWDLDLRKTDLVYCDPPYAGTTGYRDNPFDHERFWDWCRDASRRGVKVLVSEYTAPQDFLVIASTERALEMDNDKKRRQTRTERVFIHDTHWV